MEETDAGRDARGERQDLHEEHARPGAPFPDRGERNEGRQVQEEVRRVPVDEMPRQGPPGLEAAGGLAQIDEKPREEGSQRARDR